MVTIDSCFDCQKYNCDECPKLETENGLVNPETEKKITTQDIDELLGDGRR